MSAADEESADRGALEGAGSGTLGGAGLLSQRAPLPSLLLEMLYVQWWELGPWAQIVMAKAALPQMFNGMHAIGAAQVIAAVRLDNRSQTVAIAKLTAIIVKLEAVDLVAGITSTVARDCPECVAKVSIELMLMKEMQVLTLITKQMVERGELTEAAVIAKEMAKHGNSEFLKIVASDTAPNPIEKTKQSIGKAGNWLARKSGCGDSGSDQHLATSITAIGYHSGINITWIMLTQEKDD